MGFHILAAIDVEVSGDNGTLICQVEVIQYTSVV